MDRNSRRGRKTRVHSIESLETRVLLAADWQNPIDARDVDASGDEVSPIDALLVINELNSPTVSDAVSGQLPELGEDPPPFFDVDGNGIVSPLDALLVVNGLPDTSGDSATGSTEFQPGDSVIVGMPSSRAEGVLHDTLVNAHTRSIQRDADVAATLRGNSIIVWASLGQDGSGYGIFGQRYDDSGGKVGDEFQINQRARGAQRRPSVAMWDDGSFIVAWDSVRADGSGFGIVARSFNSDGSAATQEFVVNSTTKGNQTRADVAVMQGTQLNGLLGQSAYITWAGRGRGDRNGVFYTSVEFGETSTSGEWRANHSTSGKQANPAIDVSDDGLIGVAWEGKGPQDNRGIYMDLFGSNGNSVLGQTLVNNANHRLESYPALSFAPRGSLANDQLVVAWKTHAGEPGAGVRARQYDVMAIADSGGRFAALGSRVIHVNQTTSGAQRAPSVAHLDDSTFLVSWFGKGRGDRHGVFSRQFAGDGTSLSHESRVNETTSATQARPSVAAASNGYIIAWDGKGPSDHRGVFARFVDTELGAPFFINDIDDQTIDEGSTLNVTASVTDLDGEPDTVVFSFGNAVPAGAMIDPTSGQITWATDEADGGQSFVFNVVATDTTNFSDSTSFSVFVDEINNGVSISPTEDQVVTAGQQLTVVVTATDPDGGEVTLSSMLAGGGELPSWLTFDPATGTYTGMPQQSDVGSILVTTTATDSQGETAFDTFAITVLSAETGFEFDVPDQFANVGQLFSTDLDDFITLDGTVDPGVISYNLDNVPDWLLFDSTTNVLSGTPASVDVGTETITALAISGNGTGSVLDTFNITVNDVNLAPRVFDQTMRVSPTAPNGSTVGQVIGSDPNAGDTLTYEITAGNGRNAFAIDAGSGIITVADSSQLVDDSTVVLTVTATDSGSPQLSGSGQVTININSAPVTAAYTLGTFDLEGDAISSIMPGQEFELRLFAADRRLGMEPDEGGVFAAFADIVYSSALVSASGNIASGDIVISTLYNAAASGSAAVLGLVDEVGGVDGISELGTEPREIARIRMQAGLVEGMVLFATDVADDSIQHPTLVFGQDEEIPASLIDFGTTSLSISSNDEVFLTVGRGSGPSDRSSLNADVWQQADSAAVETTPLAPSLVVSALTGFGQSNANDAEDSYESSVTDQFFAQLGNELD